MQTANEKLRDALIKRQSYLQLLAKRYRLDVLDELDSTIPAVKAMIAEQLPNIKGSLNTAKSAGRFAAIGKQYEKIRQPAYSAAETAYMETMAKLANDEAEFIAGSLKQSVPFDISTAAVTGTAISNITAFGAFQGKTIAQWFNGVSSSDFSRFEGVVRAGVNRGLTIDNMITYAIGTYSKRTGKYSGDIQVSRNAAETAVRTITNGVTNDAREEFYKANADIISYEIYQAVLDGRTSLICAGLDGEKFKVGEGPIPPAHDNCRSIRIPVIDGIGLLGERPSVGGVNFRKDARETYINNRAKKGDDYKTATGKWNNLSNSSKNGYINKARRAYAGNVIGTEAPGTSYGTWLKKQSVDLQNDVLGATNAQKFRAGEMTLDKFTDKFGKPLTLDELRSKYPEIYR